MDIYCVYVHLFPNDKKYVGITKDIENRWRKDGSGYQHQKLVYRAILKYGWEKVKHVVLHENLTLEAAEELEIFYITFYDSANPANGYNICGGGKVNSGFSFTHTPEAKAKISAAGKGRKLSEKQKQQISKARTGKKVSESTKNKLSRIAKEMPQEQRDKISATLKQRHKEGCFENSKKFTKGQIPWNKGVDKNDPRSSYLRKPGQFRHSEETKKKNERIENRKTGKK